MALLSSLSAKDLQHYHEVVMRSTEVRSHFDLLAWLQGDLQRYLPHEILIASWGAFGSGDLQFDIISPLPGVRSRNTEPDTLGMILIALYQRWKEFGSKPFTVDAEVRGFPTGGADSNPVNRALETMKSAMVHGVIDTRGNHDCLYVAFNSRHSFRERERAALAVILPYIDTALRQIRHLPRHGNKNGTTYAAEQQSDTIVAELPSMMEAYNLSDRESQILHWVAMGKTNPEIASILHISSFTVKNHMQRVFKKLDVTNRAQAVSKLRPMPRNHVQN